MRVTLYTKPPIAVFARSGGDVAPIGGKIHFELEFVNPDVIQLRYGTYRERIPVIAVNGEEVAAAPLE